MKMAMRPMTKPEEMYCYTQSQQIRNQTGNIGFLRADMDTDGNGFFSSWTGFRYDLKTEAFKDEFDELINCLRSGDGPECFLRNRTTLANYCFSHIGTQLSEQYSFGFRVDTEKYSYMMRLNPNRGEYNLYCYCYVKDWLDSHLKKAERGIRFINSRYDELFRIPDGGKIWLIYPDGQVREETCRYIDDYHFELGFGSLNLFHICEFAEHTEENGIQIEPVMEGRTQRETQRGKRTVSTDKER